MYPGDRYGWMSFGYRSFWWKDYTWNVAGYPGDKRRSAGRTIRSWPWMWHDSDGTYKIESLGIKHKVDTRAGQSGSALYMLTTGRKRIIYGVHNSWAGWPYSATSTPYNYAARITKARFAQICGWIASDPGSAVC